MNYDAILDDLNRRFSSNGACRSLSDGTLRIEGVSVTTANTEQLSVKPIHKHNQKHTGPRPDAAGCKVASDGLHSWMKNGAHPVSKKQRWRCLRCKVSVNENGVSGRAG